MADEFNLVFDDSPQDRDGQSEKHIECMLYIYNCIMDGWTVRKVGASTFEFKKDRQQEIRDIYKRFFSVNRDAETKPSLNYLDAFLLQMTGKNYGN